MSIWEKVFGPKKYTSKSGDKISKTSDGKLTIDRSRKTGKGNKKSTYTYEGKWYGASSTSCTKWQQRKPKTMLNSYWEQRS